MNTYKKKLEKMSNKQLQKEYWKIRDALERIESRKRKRVEGFCIFCNKENSGALRSCMKCGFFDHSKCIKDNDPFAEYLCPTCKPDEADCDHSDEEYVPDVDFDPEDFNFKADFLPEKRDRIPKKKARSVPKQRTTTERMEIEQSETFPSYFMNNPYRDLDAVDLVKLLVKYEKALQKCQMEEEFKALYAQKERFSASSKKCSMRNLAMEREIERLRDKNEGAKDKLELLEIDHAHISNENKNLKKKLSSLSHCGSVMPVQAWVPTSPVISPRNPMIFDMVECVVCGQTGGKQILCCHCNIASIHQHCARFRVSEDWKCSDCTGDFTLKVKS